MGKYRGGHFFGRSVLFFLFVLFSACIFGNLKTFAYEQLAGDREVDFFSNNDTDISFEDGFDVRKRFPRCNPPPEQPYTRIWNLNNWLRDHASLESSLRGVYTTQKGFSDPASFKGLRWKREITQFRQAWSMFIGIIPQKKCLPLDVQEEGLGLTPSELALVNTSSYQMKRVSYRGVHGERIPAYLLIPNSLRPGDKVPAVLAMHQSLAVCGKKEPAGVCLQGTSWLDFAQDFAERGFVTLAPDSIGYGDRSEYSDDYGLEYADAAPLLSRFPSSTLMGLRISDVKRGVDYLQALPFVDGKRIGMIGHSNGGIETLFNAAFDKRIKCAVSNAGPNLLRRETYGYGGWNPGVMRWAGWAYMPSLGFFNNDLQNAPIEVHQLYAMIAPRGLFLSLVEDDTIAPQFDRIQFTMDETKRVFDALGGNFAYHTITTGLTPENRVEWAAPMDLSEKYDKCIASGDPMCTSFFNAVGITPECIATKGHIQYCAHDVWQDCIAMRGSEDLCITQFSATGITSSSIEVAFQKYLRRDHGWYPETEAEAYPWMETCLKK